MAKELAQAETPYQNLNATSNVRRFAFGPVHIILAISYYRPLCYLCT